MSYYRSNHDCFGNPTFVPDGYLLPITNEPEVEEVEEDEETE